MAKSTAKTTTRKPIKIEKKVSKEKADKKPAPKKPSTRKKKVVEEDIKPVPNLAKYGNEPVIDPVTDYPPVISTDTFSSTTTTTMYVDVTDPIEPVPIITDPDVDVEPKKSSSLSTWIIAVVAAIALAIVIINC